MNVIMLTGYGGGIRRGLQHINNSFIFIYLPSTFVYKVIKNLKTNQAMKTITLISEQQVISTRLKRLKSLMNTKLFQMKMWKPMKTQAMETK